MICLTVCVVVAIGLRLALARDNASRDRLHGAPEMSHGLEDLTDH